MDQAEDRLAELEARLADMLRRNLAETGAVSRLERASYGSRESATSNSSRLSARTASSTAEAEILAVRSAPRLAREVVAQYHRVRPVVREDVREDFTQRDIEAGYAELRWEYLENAPF